MSEASEMPDIAQVDLERQESLKIHLSEVQRKTDRAHSLGILVIAPFVIAYVIGWRPFGELDSNAPAPWWFLVLPIGPVALFALFEHLYSGRLRRSGRPDQCPYCKFPLSIPVKDKLYLNFTHCPSCNTHWRSGVNFNEFVGTERERFKSNQFAFSLCVLLASFRFLHDAWPTSSWVGIDLVIGVPVLGSTIMLILSLGHRTSGRANHFIEGQAGNNVDLHRREKFAKSVAESIRRRQCRQPFILSGVAITLSAFIITHHVYLDVFTVDGLILVGMPCVVGMALMHFLYVDWPLFRGAGNCYQCGRPIERSEAVDLRKKGAACPDCGSLWDPDEVNLSSVSQGVDSSRLKLDSGGELATCLEGMYLSKQELLEFQRLIRKWSVPNLVVVLLMVASAVAAAMSAFVWKSYFAMQCFLSSTVVFLIAISVIESIGVRGFMRRRDNECPYCGVRVSTYRIRQMTVPDTKCTSCNRHWGSGRIAEN